MSCFYALEARSCHILCTNYYIAIKGVTVCLLRALLLLPIYSIHVADILIKYQWYISQL